MTYRKCRLVVLQPDNLVLWEHKTIPKGVPIMDLAERIQYLRKKKGISQEELADKMLISRQAVSKWESGVSQT